MGEAKRRGTRTERIAQSIVRQEIEAELRATAKAERIAKRRANYSPRLATIVGMTMGAGTLQDIKHGE